MSEATLSHYNQLLADGMSAPDARQAAEAAAKQRDADERVRRLAERVDQIDQARAEAVAERTKAEQAAAEARAHANQAAAASAQAGQTAGQVATQAAGQVVAHSEDKAKARFVSKDTFHAAIRALPTREEMNAALAQVRKEFHDRMDRLERRMDANFRLVFAIGVAIFVAVIAQFFRGG